MAYSDAPAVHHSEGTWLLFGVREGKGRDVKRVPQAQQGHVIGWCARCLSPVPAGNDVPGRDRGGLATSCVDGGGAAHDKRRGLGVNPGRGGGPLRIRMAATRCRPFIVVLCDLWWDGGDALGRCQCPFTGSVVRGGCWVVDQ